MSNRRFATGVGTLASLVVVALVAAPAQAQQAAAYNQQFEDSSAISGWYQNTYGYPISISWAVDDLPAEGHSTPYSLNLGSNDGLNNVDEAYGYIESTEIDCSGLNSAVLSFWCRADIGNINNMYWYGRELQIYSNSYWNYWSMGDSNYTLDCGTNGEWHQHQISLDPAILSDGAFRLWFYMDLGLYGEGNGREGWFLDDIQILVPDVTPPDAVTDLAASVATQTSIQIDWSAPFDDDVSGVTASYDLRYATSPITGTTFSSATQVNGEPAPDVEGTPHSMVITGLTENTTYYFALQVTDIAGNPSAISNVATLATLAPPPPPPPPTANVEPAEIKEPPDDILPCSAGTQSAPIGLMGLAGLVVLAFALRKRA